MFPSADSNDDTSKLPQKMLPSHSCLRMLCELPGTQPKALMSQVHSWMRHFLPGLTASDLYLYFVLRLPRTHPTLHRMSQELHLAPDPQVFHPSLQFQAHLPSSLPPYTSSPAPSTHTLAFVLLKKSMPNSTHSPLLSQARLI